VTCSAWASKAPPGAATEASADKLENIGVKFEKQLEELEEKFIDNTQIYETRICEGIGCEKDDRKRANYRIEWDGIVRAYKQDKGHLVQMLAMCWKAKNSSPLHRIFAEWIAQKKAEAKSATVWNVERELRCEHYSMGFEDLGAGDCGRAAGGGGIIVPKPAAQPSGCIPMPTKSAGEGAEAEEAAKDAPYQFHCARQCECMALCDLGSGCTHAAWNKDEMSDSSKENCVLYGGSECTPSGEAGWSVFTPEA